MQANSVELVLTCGSWQEAQKIADVLLEQKLVACVEFMDVQSKYWWHNRLEEAKEVKLVMQSVAGNFDKVEREVKRLHSYDTFVLQMLPVQQLSQGAAEWLKGEVDHD